jgi:hypothetical protein
MGPGNEKTLALLVLVSLGGMAIYRLVLWLMDAPRTAEPWGDEIDKALAQDDAVPLCHHCFTPQEHIGWFCPECGATVGPYCNYMPYVYVFSQGEVLRAGVLEHLRCTALIVIGFIVFSLGMFSIGGPLLFAVPIYWFFLFRNLLRSNNTAPDIFTGEAAPVPGVTTPTSTDIETFKRCPWCGKAYSIEATVCPIDGHQLVSKKRTQ